MGVTTSAPGPGQPLTPRRGWVLAWWPATECRLVLALDATTLGQRFTVLTLRVGSRGWAIPVAWPVVDATRQGAWRAPRLVEHPRLVRCLHTRVLHRSDG